MISKNVSKILMFSLLFSCFFSGISYSLEEGLSEQNPKWVDSNKKVENPYPDKITDEDIKANNTDPKGYSTDNNILKIELKLKDGKTYPIYDGKYIDGEKNKKPIDTSYLQKNAGNLDSLEIYSAYMPSGNTKTIVGAGFSNMIYYDNNKLEITPDKNIIYKEGIPRESMDINGENVDSRIEYIGMKKINETQFFHWSYKYPEDKFVEWQSIVIYTVKTGSHYKGGNASFFSSRSNIIPKTIFHYVDEKEYRNATGVRSENIPQRSKGKDWSATEPGVKLNIKDIAPSVSVSDTYLGYIWNIYPYFYTEKRKNQMIFDENGVVIKSGEKPTYESLKSLKIDDYEYIGDDIDKPEDMSILNNLESEEPRPVGNWYITPVMTPDGKVSFEKHYYILYKSLKPDIPNIYVPDGEKDIPDNNPEEVKPDNEPEIEKPDGDNNTEYKPNTDKDTNKDNNKKDDKNTNKDNNKKDDKNTIGITISHNTAEKLPKTGDIGLALFAIFAFASIATFIYITYIEH